MFSRVLGLSDHSENIFKLSRRKLLFIFCIFLMYKIISISFDLTIKFLMFALQIVFEDLKWSVEHLLDHLHRKKINIY